MRYLTITNKQYGKETILDYDSLDFGLGDYFYNGACTNSQIAFYWSEEKNDCLFVEHLYCNVYVGDEKNNDLIPYDKTLKNLTPNKELFITLSDDDYEVFEEWYNTCRKKDMQYMSEEEFNKNGERYLK